MAYLGNNLTVQQYAPQIAYFSGNGSTTAFTLPVGVVSAAQILVFVANVGQNPSSAYSVSGTTLTFTSAPPTGTNNIWVEYTSLQTNTIAPSAGTVGTAAIQSSVTLTTPAIAGATSGSITLAAPAVAGTNTATLPAATGTVMVSGNMPAFSVYQSTAQTLSSVTNTKIQLQTKEFDTANAFDNTTNYRFQPTVAGYYQVSGALRTNVSNTLIRPMIYKNGSGYKTGSDSGSGNASSSEVSCIVYLNGSTDYVEFWGLIGSGQVLAASSQDTWFQGVLVRAA